MAIVAFEIHFMMDLMRTTFGLALFSAMLVVWCVTFCAIHCCLDAVRKVPTNYFLLLTFTVATAVIVGFICADYAD